MARRKPVSAQLDPGSRHGPRAGALLESVMQNVLESIMITDTQGKILYVNGAFERITGYPPAEALGEMPSILKSGEHGPEFYQKMWHALLEGKPWKGELVNRRKSGELYHAELAVAPVVDSSGAVTHYIASHRDISDEIERRRMEGELEALRTDMVGIVTHDLRNPVANVIGYLDLVMGGLDALTERQLHLIKRARDNANFMLELIADVLDTTRIDAGKLRLVAMPHDVRDVVRESLERSDFLAKDKSISLEAHLPDEVLPAPVDRGKIIQVLNNLISNAIKFSSPGATVRVGARRAGRAVEVWVADQGPGVPAAEVPLLFKKFWRGSSRATRGEKSTGLGLYIVNEMLRLHQGTIRVDTAPGRGATFTFTLPA